MYVKKIKKQIDDDFIILLFILNNEDEMPKLKDMIHNVLVKTYTKNNNLFCLTSTILNIVSPFNRFNLKELFEIDILIDDFINDSKTNDELNIKFKQLTDKIFELDAKKDNTLNNVIIDNKDNIEIKYNDKKPKNIKDLERYYSKKDEINKQRLKQRLLKGGQLQARNYGKITLNDFNDIEQTALNRDVLQKLKEITIYKYNYIDLIQIKKRFNNDYKHIEPFVKMYDYFKLNDSIQLRVNDNNIFNYIIRNKSLSVNVYKNKEFFELNDYNINKLKIKLKELYKQKSDKIYIIRK